MENIERDVKILDKLLNSKLFLGKYPKIKRVAVERYGKRIDIVLIPDDMDEYWLLQNEIMNYIWSISRLASVESNFDIYP